MRRRFGKWGTGGADTEWLRRAGFTRRNTRRAILSFLGGGLWPGERILDLRSGTYRLQMGFLAITDRRLVLGMSWAFIPFINRRRGVPLEYVTWVRMDSKPWGARLLLDSTMGKAAFGDLEEDEAERLARFVARLAARAKARAGDQSLIGRARGESSPSGSLPSRPTYPSAPPTTT